MCVQIHQSEHLLRFIPHSLTVMPFADILSASLQFFWLRLSFYISVSVTGDTSDPNINADFPPPFSKEECVHLHLRGCLRSDTE